MSYEENRQKEMLVELKVDEDILDLLPNDKVYPSTIGNPGDSKISEEDKKRLIIMLVSISYSYHF